jgi:uncharacterized protein YkwD
VAGRPLADVNARYWSQWASGAATSSNWLGNLLGCLLGTDSSAGNEAGLRAVNYARWLVGLAPVALDPALNRKALGAALIMQANQVLTHAPSRLLRCWTSGGDDGARHSNLAWRYPAITPVQAVDMYLKDPGAGNADVGHRRWLLYPPTTRIGMGTTSQYSATYVIGPTASGRPSPRYVRWPSAGWFPNPLAPQRWSLGGPGLKLGRATVSVYRGPVRLAIHRERVVTGYGQPTLVWTMPAGYARTGSYEVVVRNIHRAGTRKAFSTSWTVSLFTPSR